MSDLPEFWTPEPIEAWKVVLHSTDEWMRSTGWPTYALPYMGDAVDVTARSSEARCRRNPGFERFIGQSEPPHSEPAPVAECSCGWYSWKTLDDATVYAKRLANIGDAISDAAPPEVWRVQLSGVVIEHERGYRSQYVRWIERVA